jgi:hypothetical protein
MLRKNIAPFIGNEFPTTFIGERRHVFADDQPRQSADLKSALLAALKAPNEIMFRQNFAASLREAGLSLSAQQHLLRSGVITYRKQRLVRATPSDPIGSRKQWGDRVYEKQEDGRWLPVGAGAKTEQQQARMEGIDLDSLTQEQLVAVLKENLERKAAQGKSK